MRLTIMKPLREAEILKLRKIVQKEVLPAIYHRETKSGMQPVFDGSIRHTRGESQITIQLPAIRIRGKDRRFVLKIPIHPAGQRIMPDLPGNHTMLYSTLKVGMQEGTSDLLRRKGIQCPAHHAIGIVRGLTGNIVQDLEEIGNIQEADGFDFANVSNEARLKEEFERHVQTLKQMQQDGAITPERHREKPERPYQRAFLIAQKDGGNKAVLIAADLDNFYMNEKSKDPEHNAARKIEDDLYIEFMGAVSSRKSKKQSLRFGPIPL